MTEQNVQVVRQAARACTTFAELADMLVDMTTLADIETNPVFLAVFREMERRVNAAVDSKLRARAPGGDLPAPQS